MLNVDNVQIRNKLKSLTTACNEVDSGLKESNLHYTLELDKMNSQMEDLESDVSSERTLVFAQINNLENMIQRIAALPTQTETDDG